jgi:hypothetical protein|tara:strand:- start:1220 stop:1831 length:612 start_codon:yes stop_codon:yes gene_type:complete
MLEKAKKYTSPFGKALYPYLSKADVKFKAEGEFKVDLEVGGQEADELKKLINSWSDMSVKQAQEKTGKKSVKKTSSLPYKETEDGKTIFKFKMKASGTNGKTGDTFKQRPALFDNELKPINPEEVSIWGGSTLRVSYQPALWFTPMLGAGVSLRLKSVQVKNLIEGGAQTGDTSGFDKVDGDASSKNNSDENKEEEVANEADF